ncbi:MAG: hypothetical protein IPN69_08745 [Acidobacteria bacterium]|nr:hypothetical protein [Acidobacteriota bacterium]
MYRPKEEVSVKGYIRHYDGGKLGDIGALRRPRRQERDLRDARRARQRDHEGAAELNAFGAFDFKFKLTDNMNLGMATVELKTEGGAYTHYHQFQVQEFRRPGIRGQGARRIRGAALRQGQCDVWRRSEILRRRRARERRNELDRDRDADELHAAEPRGLAPLERVPWWRTFGDYDGGFQAGRRPIGDADVQGSDRRSRKTSLKVDFESVNPPRPYTVSASGLGSGCQPTDVGEFDESAGSSGGSVCRHQVGAKLRPEGRENGGRVDRHRSRRQTVANRDVEIKAVLKDRAFEKGSWIEKTVDEQVCNVKSLGDKGQKCEFVAKAGGQYRISARVMDDKERFNESEFTIWVPGGKTPPKRNVEQEEAQLIPNKKDYKAGETAELFVISPFAQAEGVLTLRRGGLIKTERFSVKDSSITLRAPLEEKYLPNIYAQVDLVGAAAAEREGRDRRKLAKRPAFASGQINLQISTESRKLNVSAEPESATIEPGGETKVNVAVTDFRGEPVANSEVAVVVVDESVLALSGYSIADPLGAFYGQRGNGVTDYHSRKDILLGNPLDVRKQEPQIQATMAAGAVSNTAIMARKSDMNDAKKSAPRPSAVRSEEMVADKMVAERDEEASPDTPDQSADEL